MNIRKCLLPTLAAAFLLTTPTHAHSWYEKLVNDQGLGCCGGNDCGPLPVQSVKPIGNGEWEVLIPKGVHPMAKEGGVFYFKGMPQPSQDGDYHACVVFSEISSGIIRCLFIPGTM